jgi:hypothetical protein
MKIKQFQRLSLVTVGIILAGLFTVGCASKEESLEIVYSFSISGVECEGINYGWLNETGINEICFDRFTDGDVSIDCPIPKSISVRFETKDELEQNRSVSSYISVAPGSICNARCEIWYSSTLIASEQISAAGDEHIAHCQGRIN